MTKTKSVKGASAFTLVEVVVAIVFVTIVILAVLSAFSYARSTVYDMQQQMSATHAAREVMEQFRMLSYSDNRIAAGTSGAAPAGFTVPDEFRDSMRYFVTEDEAAPGDIKNITVTMAWPRLNGAGTGTVSVVTSHSRVLH